jgi:exopolysaccharide biosynthesis polyprenyl glycosylphosphotransferase
VIHFTHLRRRQWFAAADMISVIFSVAFAFYVRTQIPLPVFEGLMPMRIPPGFESFWTPALILGAAFVLIQYALGIYDLWHTSSISSWLHRLLPGNAMTAALAFSYLYLSKNFEFPRSYLIALFMANHCLTTVWRCLYFKITRENVSEVVLVGRGTDVAKLVHDLSNPPFSNHVRIAAVFVPETSIDTLDPNLKRYRTLKTSDFERFSATHPHASLILASSGSFQKEAFQCVLTAARRGWRIYAVPTIYEILLGRLQHLRINDMPLLELRFSPPSPVGSASKRFQDILFAILLGVILAPVMVAVGCLIKATSKGGILFTQKRIGHLGKEFQIYKFRTMVTDAEEATGPVFATQDDKRVTKVGRFLRASRIDELPQLWNILVGDMSFVGPRPERPVFVDQFEKQFPGYSERHRVRPGVTGLAQVSGSYVTSPEVKLKYDLAYISHQNALVDAQIIARTLKTVVTRAGI